MNNQVFLSHAVADQDIAAELTRLLASGLGITGKSVFCSSLPGRSIPGGFNFVNHIKSALESAEVVMLLLTENYFASQFCLAEIGACWISKKNVIPILVPPLGYEKLKATLSITQVWKINDDDGLNSLADDICTPLGIKVNNAQWGVEKKAFLKKIDPILKKKDNPAFITPEEHQECQEELEYSIKKIAELEGELDKSNSFIEELKACKDHSEVRELEISNMSEFEQFKILCETASNSLSTLPPIVCEAIYYYMKGDNLPHPHKMDSDKWDEVNEACDLKLLYYLDGEPIELNDDHPRVKKVLSPLTEFKDFIWSNEEALAEFVEDEHEVMFDLADKEFWEKFLG